MAVERRTLWLGGALVAAIVALVVLRTTDAPQATTRSGAPSRANARAAARETVADAATSVNLEHLSQARGQPADGSRNPFRFKPKPAAPAPSPTAGRGASPAAQAPAAPPAPTGPPPPPPIALKFIGIVEKADGTRIAVLSDGKRPFYGVDGQDIEGQYRILKVGLESVEIAYIDGRGRQTLRLSGQ